MSLTSTEEKKLIWALAAIQFTHIVDFMIIMPLGPQMLALFDISTTRFGLLVSSYSASAAVATLIAALLLDRFERRTALRWSYALFILATLACALSPSFNTLLFARCCAGFFGGLISVLLQTIVADTVPFERRGKAMGTIMASFSVASVAGVPLGLLAANQLGWQAPFAITALLSTVILFCCWNMLPQLREHLEGVRPSPVGSLLEVLSVPRYWLAYAFTLSMIFTGFTAIPFLTVYFQGNLGVLDAQIPLTYLAGGLATLISAPVIGRLSDHYGKARVFIALAVTLIIPLVIITHTKETNFTYLVIISTAFFIFSSGRMIPAMALIGEVPTSKHRGTYMSLNNTVQSAGMACAAFTGGILANSVDGKLMNFEYNGMLGIVANLVSICLLVMLMRGRRDLL